MSSKLNRNGVMSQLRNIPEYGYKKLNAELLQEVFEKIRKNPLKGRKSSKIKIHETENSWLFSMGFGFFNYQFFLQLKERCGRKDMTDDAFVEWYNTPISSKLKGSSAIGSCIAETIPFEWNIDMSKVHVLSPEEIKQALDHSRNVRGEVIEFEPYDVVHLADLKYKLYTPNRMMEKYEVWKVIDEESNERVGDVYCMEHSTLIKNEDRMYSSIEVMMVNPFELPKRFKLQWLRNLHPELSEQK